MTMAVCRLPGAGLPVVLGAMVLCGCVPEGKLIPINVPEPFSPELRHYLDSTPPVGRAEVVRWLGEPDLVRRDGQLLIFVRTREISRDPWPSNYTIAEVRVLLVSLDEQGRVIAHDVLPAQGCAADGTCIDSIVDPATPGSSNPKTLDAQELRHEEIKRLVVFARPGEPDGNADGNGAAGCRVRVYRAAPDGWYPYLRLRVGERPTQVLPRDAYASHLVAPGPFRVTVEWREVRNLLLQFGTVARDVDETCRAGETLFLRISLEATRMLAKDFRFSLTAAPADVGSEEIRSYRRILD